MDKISCNICNVSKIKNHLIKISLIIIILGVFFGISISANQFMFYNILIMPSIGGIAYFSLKKKCIYVCVSVFVIVYLRWLYDSFGYALEGSFLQAFIPPLWWAFIYLGLTMFGVLISALLCFGFRKEQKNEKIATTIAIIIAVLLISGLLFAANAFVGNPISKIIVTNNAKEYIETNYKDTDYYVDNVGYSFKTSVYYAHIKSLSSKDTYFSVSYNMAGKLGRDNFPTRVLDGFNTWNRINSEYRDIINEIIENLPYESDINYGEIQTLDKGNTNFGLDMSLLELDKVYDIKELGSKYGKVVLYVYVDEISVKKASEVLLEVKEQFDEKNQAFYAIDLVLRLPRNKDVNDWQDSQTIRLECFLYSNIVEKDLLENVKASIERSLTH